MPWIFISSRIANHLFLVFLLLLLVLRYAHAGVDFRNGEYFEESVDLIVKVMGGRVEMKRVWYQRQWHINRSWNALKLTLDSQTGGARRIERNGKRYSRSRGEKRFRPRYDKTTWIVEIPGGYRWEDKKGNWMEYDLEGRMQRYGDRNNVTVSLIYDANGVRTGVRDHFGNQVIWYEYDANGRLVGLRDHVDPALSRRVVYEYTGEELSRVIDVLGQTWTYRYASGNLVEIIDPEGRSRTVSYTVTGKVKETGRPGEPPMNYRFDYDETADEFYATRTHDGHTDFWRWNRAGELLVYARNGVTLINVISTGSRQIVANELGYRTRREYDPLDNLTRIVYPDGTERRYRYDSRYSNLLEEIDELGIVTRYEYDDNGNLLRKIEAVGQAEQRITEYTYDAYGNRLSERRLGDADTEESLRTWTYDGAGNVITRTDRVSSSETITIRYESYDRMGNTLIRRDGRGNVWEDAYDAKGRKVAAIDPLGNTTVYAYDSAGNLLQVTDAAGNITRNEYDSRGKLIRTVEPTGAEKRFEYDEKGRLVASYDESGNAVYRRYNPQGQLQQTTDGAGNAITIEYGIVKERNVPYGKVAAIDYPTYRQEYVYDRRGHQVEVRRILGTGTVLTTRTEYDATGRATTRIDAASRRTENRYDALGRLRLVTQPDASTVEYAYDNRDNLVAVTNENGIVIRRYTYDALNRKTEEIWPTGAVYRYAYDGNGNLIEKTDAKGQVTRYTYDAANRIERTQHYTDASTPTPAGTVTYNYDALGRLTGYDDGTTRAGYGYDELGRKLTETLIYGSITITLGYAWNPNGTLRSFTGPDGDTVTYTWDNANRLAQVRIPGEGTIVWNRYTWNAPAQITYPGGSHRAIEYDPLLRPQRINASDPAGNAVLDYRYEYDLGGNIISKATEYGEYRYVYDARDRLVEVDNPVGLPDEGWTYDPAGNRLTDRTIPGTWTYDTANALQSYGAVTLGYDANGSLTTRTVNGQTTTYIYNLDNRLSEVQDNSGATLARYGYDPFGRRIWKEVGGVRTWFVYSEEGMVAELDATGNPIQSYGYIPQSPYGTAPLYIHTRGGYAYYQLDHLGTPQVLTDKSGKVVWQGRAKAFGETTEIVNLVANPLRFPGQYEDNETGLHYNYFRYYDPEIGRYIKRDPFWQHDTNAYLYLNYNPIISFDNFGLYDPLKFLEQHCRKRTETCEEYSNRIFRLCVSGARGAGMFAHYPCRNIQAAAISLCVGTGGSGGQTVIKYCIEDKASLNNILCVG